MDIARMTCTPAALCRYPSIQVCVVAVATGPPLSSYGMFMLPGKGHHAARPAHKHEHLRGPSACVDVAPHPGASLPLSLLPICCITRSPARRSHIDLPSRPYGFLRTFSFPMTH